MFLIDYVLVVPILKFIKYCNQYQEFIETKDIEVSDNDLSIIYPKNLTDTTNKYRYMKKQKHMTKEERQKYENNEKIKQQKRDKIKQQAIQQYKELRQNKPEITHILKLLNLMKSKNMLLTDFIKH